MKLIVILLLSWSFLSFSLGDELKFDHFVVPGAEDEAVAYWTPERMKAAIPKDIINDANFNDTKFKPDGAPGHTSAAGPGGKPFNVGHEDVCSFSSGYAPSYTTYPWNVVGKVFFTQGGVNYVCSASAICNFGIVTAGHCVNSGAGVWSTNFVFVPGYNNGVAPYGMFSAYNLYAFSAWTTQASPCYDYAFATLCRYNNQPVGYYVGWFGLTWNAGYNNSWTTLGYPAAAPFTGQYNYYTSSSYCTQDGRCSPNPVGVGSDSTGGCSGGPWVIGFGSTNYVNGVNSYGYSTLPNVLFSPYFDSNVYTLYNLACPTTFLAC